MENPEGENPPKRERLPSTVSVALLLSNNPENTGVVGFFRELILVRKRDSGKWGLIAGGILEGEDTRVAALRELTEETNLGGESVEIKFRSREIKLLPGKEKTSVGIIYEAKVKRVIPRDGYEPNSEEIDLVKPFTIEDLLQLRQHPEMIYKPEFNLYLIDYWLWNYLDIKYGFWEGREFAEHIARGWGLESSWEDFFR